MISTIKYWQRHGQHPARLFLFVSVLVSLSVLLLGQNLWSSGATPSNTIVISQVYGGGGNSGATLTNDFVELFNRGTTTVDVTGWTIQYTSSAGTVWTTATPTVLSGTIAPGQYYLVQEAAGAAGTQPLPTPDATGVIAMSGTTGKVALVNNGTALAGACPTDAIIVDFVGYGPAATCSETAPTAILSNTTAALRNGNGCTETDNNANDFSVVTPAPRNKLSALSPCGGGGTPPDADGHTYADSYSDPNRYSDPDSNTYTGHGKSASRPDCHVTGLWRRRQQQCLGQFQKRLHRAFQ